MSYRGALARAVMNGWYAYARTLTALRPHVRLDDVVLSVHPGVYKPLENEQLAARHCRPGDRVLDLGCGSGVNTVFAARVAREVVAVDISAAAVRNTVENCRRLGLSNVIVRRSDMFAEVEGAFDVILANAPYTSLAMASDEHQFATSARYLPALFAGASDRLAPDGRIVLQYPARGRTSIEELARRSGLRIVQAEPLPQRGVRRTILRALYFQLGFRSTLFVLQHEKGP